MAYHPPREGEMIYATKTGVSVFTSASRNSPRSLTNNEYKDHSLREFQKDEAIGTVLSADPIFGLDGNQFLKVQNWVWIFVDDGFIKLGLVGHNEKEFHESYVDITDEPLGWIREDWKNGNTQSSEQDSKTAEIEAYISKYPGVPKPISVSKRLEDNGAIHWDITFPNGNTVDYDEFKDLTPEAKITVSSRDPLKTVVVNGPRTGTAADNTPSTLLSTQNLLIAGSVVGLFILLVVLLRRKK